MKRAFSVLGSLMLLASAPPVRAQQLGDPHPHVITLAPPTVEQFEGPQAMPRLAELAPLLFVGMVTKVDPVPGGPKLFDVTFRVSKAWKGQGLTTVTIRTGDTPFLAYRFAPDQEYLVGANSNADRHGVLGLYPGFTPVTKREAQAHTQALDAWRRAKYDADAAK
jgi:hypothetical protein